MVNIAQGKPGIVAEILREKARPMTVKELIAVMLDLGVEDDAATAYPHVYGAISYRIEKVSDIERVPGRPVRFRSRT